MVLMARGAMCQVALAFHLPLQLALDASPLCLYPLSQSNHRMSRHLRRGLVGLEERICSRQVYIDDSGYLQKPLEESL